MEEKAKLLDKQALNRMIIRMSHEIVERNKGVDNLCIVGIRNRGAFLARRIAIS
ncbi:MAG: bifunctional pyr operon transcriptional regulator/uracil phosphoribosyltransferase, partial [Planctomycetes bacterium]|nr:bifunctional pyr operon transcriptional regulator/uracil phosphoribosyltransferase [Planctomycetota bacterium]